MPQIKQTETGGHVLDTYLPQKNIKPLWIELHKELFLATAQAIRETSITDDRVSRLVSLNISLMLDQDAREKVKTKRDRLLKERFEKAKDKDGCSCITNEERARIIDDVNIEILEDVTDYLDQAFGISHHIALGLD
jgi:hypothetical protein